MSRIVKYTKEEALDYHRGNYPGNGKIEVVSKTPVKDTRDLTLAYTPGVAEVCREIVKDREKVYEYTSKGNLVAIITDGSRILGLGDIGPEAGLPVMEGKSILFKTLGGVDAFPLCLASKDPDLFIETVKNISPVFSGINLEDIATPKCFYIEKRLKEELDIPVFHDDQHGTSVVVLAGLINALKVVGKKISEVKVVMNGAGSSGIAISRFLLSAGVKHANMYVVDTTGILCSGRKENMNPYKEELASLTNPERKQGNLADAVKGADVLIGASGPNLFTEDMIRSMAEDAIVFPIANPMPEIDPEKAKKAGARIVATGRSDYPNQINNVLGFPAIFRGALDTRARDINEAMKLAASYAIASIVSEDELSEDYIITTPVDERVMPAEAAAVAEAAIKTGVARIKVNPKEVAENTRRMREFYEKWHAPLAKGRKK